MGLISSIVATSLVGLSLGACAASRPSAEVVHSDGAVMRREDPTIHAVAASPAGILVNAYLVEGREGVVAIDSALTVSDARRLREKLDALGKPLRAVLLTHGHPDHYNGVAALLEGRDHAEVYASRHVAQVIRDSDAAKEAQWKPMFGDEWPTPRSLPSRELEDGASLELAGLRFTLHDLGAGESHADSYWALDADSRYAFVGDVIMHGVHAYTSDGHTGAWLRNIERLRSELAGVHTIYPGHGPSGGLELLAVQTQYLVTYRGEVERLRAGADALSDPSKAELTAAMKRHYPEAGLEFLIALGADAVAHELASEQ